MKEYIYLNSSISNSGLQADDVGLLLSSEDNGNSCRVKFLREDVTLSIPGSYCNIFDIKNTGDRHDYKICDRCFKRLETNTCFSNNRIKKDNVITKRPSCKLCRKAKDGKAISRADREKWNLKKPKDFEPFTCPICLKTTIAGLSKIVLDHCHKTGKVRGFLCESCNTGIGRFDDSPELIARAKDWLKTN